MTAKHRVTPLTTTELYRLDKACTVVRQAFGHPPYLVGSAGAGTADTWRDVDVRLILDDGEFAEACPTKERWELLSLAISVYLTTASGLPVDFQIQQMSAANEKHDGPRNPLGMGRIFAGGGDATPPWKGTP